MKKQLFILAALGIGIVSFAQIKTNKTVSQDVIPNQTAFLDASSTVQWNSSTNIGKGLVFPRTDLTQLKTLIAVPNGITTAYPTRLDGMLVYNTATGTSGIGSVPVKPGFYYYENKSATLNGGTWRALTPEQAAAQNIYTANGTLTADRMVSMGGKKLIFASPGSIGVGISDPKATLHIEKGGDLSSTSTTHHLTIGSHNGANIGIDNNEIMARNNGQVSGLGVQADGGEFNIWNNNPDKTQIVKFVDGKLGLGVIPTVKLDVYGDAKISGLSGSGDRIVLAGANGQLKAGSAATSLGKTYTAGQGIEISSTNVVSAKTPIRTVTGAVTLAVTDNGGYVYVNSASAVSVTIPSALPVGFSCVVVQKGAGQVILQGGSGVTLQSARGTKTRIQYSAVGVIKDTTSTATITGDAVL